MRKILLFLLLLFSFEVFAEYSEDPSDVIEVFDLNFSFDNEKASFHLMEYDSFCAALFIDERKAEINIVYCVKSEYDKLKKIAFESKVLVKSVDDRVDYEALNVYKTIIDKFRIFAPKTKEEYKNVDAFGFVKVTYFLTQSLSNKILDVEDLVGSDRGSEKNKFTVWSFTDEVQTIIDKYYMCDRPEVDIEYSLTPTDQFCNKLDPVLASGRGAPDVFVLEDSFVRKYVEQGDKLLLDLTDIYNETKDKMIPYLAQVGMKDGKVYALSWQACPGAFFYRRSLARKYLGTDDPIAVQNALRDWGSFLATARKLKNASGGKCVILSTTGDLFKPFQGARKGPWIQGGKLVVDPAMDDYMDMAKTLKDEGLEGRQGQWSEGWFAGFKGELRDEYGYPVEVFGTFLPTWGLHYVIKPNAGNTAGDWGMVEGPSPYRWGGTWIAAYKRTKKTQLAKDFIKYVATDDQFLTRWARNTGDLVSNNNVINAIEGSFNDPFLAGQNHYEEFAKIANEVNGKTVQATDQAVESFWGEAVGAFINGEKTKSEALADFKRCVVGDGLACDDISTNGIIPIVEDSEEIQEELAWYTSLGDIITYTNDLPSSSVVLDVFLGYKKGDSVSLAEIRAKRTQIREFIKKILAAKTTEDFNSYNNAKIRIEICNEINNAILNSGKIIVVSFDKLIVMPQE